MKIQVDIHKLNDAIEAAFNMETLRRGRNRINRHQDAANPSKRPDVVGQMEWLD